MIEALNLKNNAETRYRCQLSVYRTIGPLVYIIPMLRRPLSSSDGVRQPFSKVFSETAWPIKVKCYEKPPWVGESKFCSRHLCHMTKMAATPIYVKTLQIFFSGTSGPISTKLCMNHRKLLPIIVCSNDDPGLTFKLTYFTAR